VIDPAIETHYGTGYERSRLFPGGQPSLEFVRSMELLERLLPAPPARVLDVTGYAQVIFYDQRGHGRSDYSSAEHWNLRTWASDLRGFCDAVRIDRPVVLGSSFGGFVALTYAALFPNHPGGVILTNTTGGRTDYARSVELFRRLGGDQTADVAARDFAEKTEESAAAFDRVCYPLYSARPGYVEEAAWRTRLASAPARSTCTTGATRNRTLIPGTCCRAFPARSRSSPVRTTPSAR
jgi:proline iminopeptidase